MIDFSKLTSSHYFFDRTPDSDFSFGFGLLAFFLLLIFSGAIFRKISSQNKYLKKSGRKQFWPLALLGGLGVILVLARFGQVPVFSARIGLYLVFVAAILLLLTTFVRIFLHYRKRLHSVQREKSN